MNAQDSWNWKVPTIHGTQWERDAVAAGNDLYINIYCEGKRDDEPHTLYLVGSIVAPSIVVENDGLYLWSPSREYITGDGYSIQLGARRQMSKAGTGELGISGKAKTFVGNHEITTVDELIDVLKWERGNQTGSTNVRTSHELRCSKCRLGPSISTDNPRKINAFATPYYLAGGREVSLREFIRHTVE